jgi:hypothetical protein
MARPTELAESYFRQAQGSFTRGVLKGSAQSGDSVELQLAAGLVNAMEGLVHLSTGLRATYILLEEVKGLLQHR